MANYNLQPNEAFILSSEHVYSGKSSGELILTNLNLIFLIEKRGMFKTTYIPQIYPVNQIKVFNGKAQVVAGKNGNIDIFFINGQESFRFGDDGALFGGKKGEKEAAKWVAAVNQLITGQATEIDLSGNTALSGTEFIAGSIKGTLDTFKGALGIKTKDDNKLPEKIATKCSACGASVSGLQGQIINCQYCGTEQQL
jgi:hypothetical protein